MVDPPIVPESYRVMSTPQHQQETVPVITTTQPKQSDNNNTTIIKLSESGTVINNTMIPMRNEQQRSTTVHVENGDVTVKENSHNKNNFRVNITNDANNADAGTKLADICFVSRKFETKTVTVEVHRGPAEEAGTNVPPPPPMFSNNDRHSSLSSSLSIPSSCDGSSLNSAISEELKKRAEVREYLFNVVRDNQFFFFSVENMK